jgi:hypothetical protein
MFNKTTQFQLISFAGRCYLEVFTPPLLFLVGSSRNPGTPTRNGRIPGGFLEELPGLFSQPMPTEMIIPDTLQSWRIPPGILAN